MQERRPPPAESALLGEIRIPNSPPTTGRPCAVIKEGLGASGNDMVEKSSGGATVPVA